MTTYQVQCHLKYKIVQPTEFIFMVQVAHHPDQNILGEQLTMNMPVKWHEISGCSASKPSYPVATRTL